METPPVNTTIINVCIIPSPEAGARCVEISQSMKTEDTMFVLGKDKFAHMTVFMARFPNSAIEPIIRAVKDVLCSAESFSCEHTGYFLTAGRYMEASYRKTPQFMNLHETIIGRVKDFRSNPDKTFEEKYFTPYTTQQRKNVGETGYDLARELYRPHITLTRYFEGKVPSVFPAVPAINLSFNLKTIGVYKADDNGAVYEALATLEI